MKLFKKLAVAAIGAVMALGVGVGVSASTKGVPAKAASSTITISDVASDLGWANAETITDFSYGGFDFSCVKVSGSNPPKYYTSGSTLRFYNKCTMTVSKAGSKVTDVTTNPAASSSNASGNSFICTFTDTVKVKTITITYSSAGTQLSTPQNLEQADGLFSWDEVEHASSYTLTLDGVDYSDITDTMFEVPGYTKGKHSAYVIAVGNGSTYSNSEQSETLTWDDTEYTNLPNGDYPVDITISGSGASIPAKQEFVLKADTANEVYRKFELMYSGVTNQYSNEYTIAKDSGFIQSNNLTNAIIKTVTLKYYLSASAIMYVDGSPVVPSDDGTYATYEINAQNFKLMGGSQYNQSFYSMSILLNVGGKSEVLNRVVLTKDDSLVKKQYYVGDQSSTDGLTATAYWRFEGEEIDSKNLDVTANVTWTISEAVISSSTTSLTYKATYLSMDSNEITIDSITILVVKRYRKVDCLTKALTGVGNASPAYVSWSDKSCSVSISNGSGAVYAGSTAKTLAENDYIQLRYDTTDSKKSGIVSTTSGGIIAKVEIKWDSSVSRSSIKKLNIYGSNTAYSGYKDLYDNSKRGDLLGTLIHGKEESDDTTELNISGNYSYIGIISDSAVYVNYINITWNVNIEAADVTSLDSFADNSLKMNSYHIDHVYGDTTGDGSCKTYFDSAKTAFNSLTATQRYAFANSGEYADAWLRFQEWGKANGKAISVDETGTLQFSNPNMRLFGTTNDSSFIVVTICLISVSAVGGYFFLRKKKETF